MWPIVAVTICSPCCALLYTEIGTVTSRNLTSIFFLLVGMVTDSCTEMGSSQNIAAIVLHGLKVSGVKQVNNGCRARLNVPLFPS